MSKLKKIGLLSIFLVMLFPVSNVFAEEYDFNNGLLDDSSIIKNNNLNSNMFDNDLDTSSLLYNSTSEYYTEPYVVEFNSPVNLKSIYFDSVTSYVKIDLYFNDGSTSNFSIDKTMKGLYTDLIFENVVKINILTTTTVDLMELDFFGTYDVTEPTEPEDMTPPSNVTNVQTTVTSSSVKLSYDLPLDEDFSHLEIHRDSQLVADNVVLNSYVDSPLLPDTHYVYTIKSVDVNGNVSSGEIVGVTTVKENDIVPPDVPTGLDTSIHNSALSINWNSVDVIDLEGYNIYVNGVKHNSTLITGTSYNLYNLENGVSYDIQVSAVDTSGNESALSSVVSNTPSMDALPIFKMGYSLEDVSKSVSNWFSEFWLILAFATSIPLSFLIANRVKSLFIA